MSRFLKFIVNVVVICTILAVVALVVPPFFGVTTEVVKDGSAGGNLPVGSATYAIPVKAEEILSGDKILVTAQNAVYSYSVAGLDLSSRIGTVVDTAVDPSLRQAEPTYVSFSDYIPKIVLTVPFIGYLMIATQRIEGMIILGLVALFLIILYVIAELWKPADDTDEIADTEAGYVKTPKELKKEEKIRKRQMEQEEARIRQQEKLRKKSRDGKIRTGGFVDEVDEGDFVDDSRDSYSSAASEAHAELKKEIAAATAGQGRQDDPRYQERPRATYAQDYEDDRRYRRPQRPDAYEEEGYLGADDRSYRESGYPRRDYRDARYDAPRYGGQPGDDMGYDEPRRGYRRDYGYGEPSYREEYDPEARRDSYPSYRDDYQDQGQDSYPSYRDDYEGSGEMRRGRYRDDRDRADGYDRRRYRQESAPAQDQDYPYGDEGTAVTSEEESYEAQPQPARRTRTARPYANIPSAPRKPADPEEAPQEQQGEEGSRRMLGMPRYTEDQLRAQAADAGDQVDVVRDDVTKVALFDYSDDLFEEAAQDMGDEDDF